MSSIFCSSLLLLQTSIYIVSCVFLFFFFKQKTAYEMRISDWSSDVCSSDLTKHNARPRDRRWAVLPKENTMSLRIGVVGTGALGRHHAQIGRASCRERVCQYV